MSLEPSSRRIDLIVVAHSTSVVVLLVGSNSTVRCRFGEDARFDFCTQFPTSTAAAATAAGDC